MQYEGSCHCGNVKFVVEAPDSLEVERCNCSVCTKAGYLHLIVPKRNFNLVKGESDLNTYTFNTRVAQHYFCQNCGVKPFYIPRSNPDGIDVNVNCIDTPIANLNIREFDGQNWERNAHTLAHKSR